jgi:tripartite-type tricarboxylate transporter receptor subunit TctC
VLTDFTNITSLGQAPHVAIIAPAQNIHTLKELVAAAKSRPGGLVYGAVASTAPHLNAEHFRKAMNIEARMVPFKGAPEAITEVVANRIDIYWSPVLPALPFIEDKQLVGLAVSSRKRSSALPDIPTTFEQGYDDSEFGLWFGFYGPAKMPRDVVLKLYDETAKALANPDVQDKLKKMGIEPQPMHPDEFDAYVRKQVEVDGELARQAGLSKQ